MGRWHAYPVPVEQCQAAMRQWTDTALVRRYRIPVSALAQALGVSCQAIHQTMQTLARRGGVQRRAQERACWTLTPPYASLREASPHA